MLTKYWAEVAPTIQPLLVEEKFEIKLESYPDVIIYGFFDVVTEDGWVIDHKNTGETTQKQWTQKYVDRMHQLTIYDLAFRKMFKRDPAGLRIDCLKRLKKGPAIEIIKTSRSAVQIVALAQLMQRMKNMQKTGEFYANLNFCSSCDFDTTCNKLSFD